MLLCCNKGNNKKMICCNIGILGYWDIGILGYWDIGILGYWDIGIFRLLSLWSSRGHSIERPTPPLRYGSSAWEAPEHFSLSL
jgi:hypothetical protein